ncbi:ATP-dependent 6-phosphofructokinase [Candidatus Phytoplasma meliae]|uniref:6-phosphofructokinase n=1 Tax=Candidatus Phytoplasma meliae TaxID=1848402 RepID=A0ABS5CY52_9MOLU|nr:ATP-dependent 6-phosphofructokinase [Candidatus Phytoplasma meliae]MBP5835907.1 6-phosphofructokinase [Candidatus Phytoplasma meliae]
MKNLKECKKIAVLTSGGDAPGMNAAIRSVVLEGSKQGLQVYGVRDGYLGLYRNEIELLEPKTLPYNINVSGTFLGTSRFIPFQQNLEIREQCARNLQKLGINKLIVIGGDGSYKGAMKLQEVGIQCVGLPATIDNDIDYTDFTIGFSTALSNVVDAVLKLRDTSISHNRCSIIEVMGRDKGDLALYGGIATSADLIVTREHLLNKEAIFAKIKSLKEAKQRCAVIVVTEHIFDINALAKEIEQHSNFETRAQILGHIQRGGKPTSEDLVLATRMGSYAVELLQKDVSNCGVGLQGLHLVHVDFEKICHHQEEQYRLYNAISKLLPN